MQQKIYEIKSSICDDTKNKVRKNYIILLKIIIISQKIYEFIS